MRHLALVFVILIGALTNGWAQKNSPKEKSNVNKEYDENGNLIKYDSTYVWSWNSDSTFNFSMDDNFAFGKDFPDMFGEFFADSIFDKLGLLNGHNFESFNNDEFIKHFQHSMPDSIFIHEFPFQNDSAFNFQFGQQLPENFNFKELENIQKQFEEQLKQHSFRSPDFQTPEQQEEWDKLLQKQKKEKEEMLKKWEKKTN